MQDCSMRVKGDALHGVGVALLAAGKFRQACQAWERCGDPLGRGGGGMEYGGIFWFVLALSHHGTSSR